MELKAVSPAQLWVGSYQKLEQEILSYLKNLWCKKNACGTCGICQNLQVKQHHNLLWIEPEKNYTLEILEPIKSAIAFSLSVDESFYIIIQKADQLTPVCANSLLKSIEEPPPGYNFILCAQSKDLVLPTLKSRSSIHHFHNESNTKEHEELLSFFKKERSNEFIEFLECLEQTKPSEAQSKELAEELLEFYIEKSLEPNTKSSLEKIEIIKKGLNTIPMPGSSKLFWKNLFLQLR